MKKYAVIAGLLMMWCFPSMVCADSGTVVGYQVDAAYTVNIPSDYEISFQDSVTYVGDITIDQSQIDEGKCIRVSVVSDNELSDGKNKIPYKITCDGKEFTYADYTAKGQSSKLSVEIDDDFWKSAEAGIYTGKIAYDISYVDAGSAYKAPTGGGKSSVITLEIPDEHMVSFEGEHAVVTYETDTNDSEGSAFNVKRFSEPTFDLQIEDGWKLKRLLVDGIDRTNLVKNGKFTLPQICEDMDVVIETEAIREESSGDQSKTGDETPIMLYVSLVLLAGAAIGGTILVKGRKKNKD